MQEKFFTGINYWASKNAIRMWRDYDRESIETDLKLLAEAKITHLRVFPLWEDFQPLTAFNVCAGVYEYGFKGEPLPDTEAGKAGVDEEMCRRFEDFCALADQYGMKLTVGLLTGHMSYGNFCPPALVNLSLITSSTAIKWELKYLKYIVKRFRSIQNIVMWDLGNEINCLAGGSTTDFYTWCMTLANTIRAYDPTRPIATGFGGFEIASRQGRGLLCDMADYCDVNTVHAYNIFESAADPVNSMKPILDNVFRCRLSEDISGLPTFVQEFGAIGYLNCSKKSEAEFYRATTLSAYAHGFHGVEYWCAFDQGQLDIIPYNWNNKGSDYGFYGRTLQPKPLVTENIKINELTERLGTLPRPKINCTIIAPRDDNGGLKPTLLAAYTLAKQANLEPDFCYALDPIPDADLYIIPSVKVEMAITAVRYRQLMKKVEQGATLYISLANAFFRDIPELAGVTVNNRMDYTNSLNLHLGSTCLPITAPVKYDITENGCEVLARTDEETPVFVKNKIGKGTVYLLFAPVEADFMGRRGAFYEANTPDYAAVYREVSQSISAKKQFDIDSPFILHTEHEMEDGSTLIFAINYSMRKESGKIKVPEGYSLEAVAGSIDDRLTLTIDACDAVVLKARKN